MVTESLSTAENLCSARAKQRAVGKGYFKEVYQDRQLVEIT